MIEDNDGSTSMFPSGTYIGHVGDSFDGDSMETYWVVNCAGYVQSSEAEYQEYARELKREVVVFGSFSAEDDLAIHMCVELPHHPKVNSGPYRVKGPAPIMVIDAKHDPATSYSWVQNIRKTPGNSVLLTWEGDGYTAYGGGLSCIDTSVNKYLLTGEVPRDGLDCPVERP